MYGLSDEEIAAIREAQFEAFAPAEVALLHMADAMADTPSNVSDELYQELRQQYFCHDSELFLLAHDRGNRPSALGTRTSACENILPGGLFTPERLRNGGPYVTEILFGVLQVNFARVDASSKSLRWVTLG